MYDVTTINEAYLSILINSALCICCLMFPTGNSNRVDRQAATLLKRVEEVDPECRVEVKHSQDLIIIIIIYNIRILRISREVIELTSRT
jgi:hypothetical protein